VIVAGFGQVQLGQDALALPCVDAVVREGVGTPIPSCARAFRVRSTLNRQGLSSP
jgi:hypothetical protein